MRYRVLALGTWLAGTCSFGSSVVAGVPGMCVSAPTEENWC